MTIPEQFSRGELPEKNSSLSNSNAETYPSENSPKENFYVYIFTYTPIYSGILPYVPIYVSPLENSPEENSSVYISHIIF